MERADARLSAYFPCPPFLRSSCFWATALARTMWPRISFCLKRKRYHLWGQFWRLVHTTAIRDDEMGSARPERKPAVGRECQLSPAFSRLARMVERFGTPGRGRMAVLFTLRLVVRSGAAHFRAKMALQSPQTGGGQCT